MTERFRVRGEREGARVAEDVESGRLVELCELAGPDGLPNARRLAGARALARLDHPGLVRVLEVREVEGQTCLVREWVEGPSLRDRLRAGPLSLAEALQLARGLAESLAYLHREGVVHRDLRPLHVRLDPAGAPRLTGFERVLAPDAPRLTQAGEVVGDPSWAAPEQLRGAAVPASDVFAWGRILAAALGGTPGEEPPARAGLPPAVARLCRATQAEDPARRPSAADLVAALADAERTRERAGGARGGLGVYPVLALCLLSALAGAALNSALGGAGAAAYEAELPRSSPPAPPPSPRSSAEALEEGPLATPSWAAPPPSAAGLELLAVRLPVRELEPEEVRLRLEACARAGATALACPLPTGPELFGRWLAGRQGLAPDQRLPFAPLFVRSEVSPERVARWLERFQEWIPPAAWARQGEGRLLIAAGEAALPPAAPTLAARRVGAAGASRVIPAQPSAAALDLALLRAFQERASALLLSEWPLRASPRERSPRWREQARRLQLWRAAWADRQALRTNDGFVRFVYRLALDREGDEEGVGTNLEAMRVRKLSRAEVMSALSNSPEAKARLRRLLGSQ